MIHSYNDIFGKRSLFGHSARFGGGGGGSPPSSGIADTETGRWARRTMYPLIGQALEGEGLLPTKLQNVRKKTGLLGLDKSFDNTRETLDSNLDRILMPGDNRVRSYLMGSLERDRITAKDNLRRNLRSEQLMDKDAAYGMASAAVGNEMRMGISSMQQYNNAMATNMANQQQHGTFGTNLMGGAGSGLSAMYFASKMAGGG